MDRECVTAETHAWRFPSFAVRHNLLPQFATDPPDLPRADGWKAHRFKNRGVEVYLRVSGSEPVPVVIVREGLATGSAHLADAGGRDLQTMAFAESRQLVQAQPLAIPAGTRWCRLQLRSPDAFGWQVQHDERVALVVADPRGEQLAHLLPRAFGAVSAGAREVILRFEATGEGFHSATLFDPHGNPVRRVQRFVDFEDPGRYELELKAPVAGPREGWALELNAVQVLKTDGLLPYWSARRGDWFDPERVPHASAPQP
jgi:hypothetical protein